MVCSELIHIEFLYVFLKFISGAKGYTYYPEAKIHYKFYETPKTWFNAHLTCNRENATLAMPRNYIEASILKDILKNYRETELVHLVDTQLIHLGFHDWFGEYEFITVEGDPLYDVYHKWTTGEPNDRKSEKCGSMHCTGGLNDICCYRLKGFICQRRDPTDEDPREKPCNGFIPRSYRYATGLNKSYKLHMSPKNWTDARAICYAEGGHLAIIKNKKEKEFLQNMMKDPEYRSPLVKEKYYHAFLGAHDLFRDGFFITVKGEELKLSAYNFWSLGEPDGGKKENCVGIKMFGHLNDYSCDRPAVFFCELYTPQYDEEVFMDVNNIDGNF